MGILTRNILLAGIATLVSGRFSGPVFAQTPTTQPVGAAMQGQAAFRAAVPTGYVNNNNNYQAKALPGALANPLPGTIVIHLNGKVSVQAQAAWTSADQRFFTA